MLNMPKFDKYLEHVTRNKGTIETIKAFCRSALEERLPLGYRIKFTSTIMSFLKKFQQFGEYQDHLQILQERCVIKAKKNSPYLKIIIAMGSIINTLKSDSQSQREDFQRGINAAVDYLEVQKEGLERLESIQRIPKFTDVSKKRKYSSTSFFKPSSCPQPKRSRASKPTAENLAWFKPR